MNELLWLDQIARVAGAIVTVSAALAICVKPIRLRVINKLTRDDAARAAIRALLRQQIIDACDKAREQGGMIFYQRENLHDMFTQYEALGGNHGIKDIVDEVLELPTVKIKK